MSFPNSNLPKPPPKLPPRPGGPAGRPGAPAAPPGGGPARAGAPGLPGAPGALPAPGRAGNLAAAPAAGPSAMGFVARTAAGTVAAADQPNMQIDTRGLPPVLGPMVEAIRDYDALLVEENDYLRVCDAAGVASMSARKQQATKTYQERLRALLGDAAPMMGVPKEQREIVMRLIRCLEARCHENATLLKANMDATERVFEVMNSAVIDARRRDALYNNSGGVHYGSNSSVAYNATV